MSERARTLLDALEKRAEASLAQLDAARARAQALEAENLALRKELAALSAQMNMTRGAESASAVPSDPAEQGAAVAEPAPLEQTSESMPANSEADARHDAMARQPISAAAGAAPPSSSEPAAQRHDAGRDAPAPQALLKQWYQRYPKTFFKGHTKPLKTGIHLELAEREPWPEKLVRRTLACYVHLPRYLKAVRAGAVRVDLDGADAGVVSEEEALHARKQLESLQQQQQERERKKSEQRLDRKLSELLAKHGH
ncbi:hypothetical protein GCM10027040_16010 [Halomonas shantousis]